MRDGVRGFDKKRIILLMCVVSLLFIMAAANACTPVEGCAEGIVLDRSQNGLQGWEIYAHKIDTPIETALTAESLPDGSFSFSGLEPGMYVFSELQKNGWEAISLPMFMAEVEAKDACTNLEFINRRITECNPGQECCDEGGQYLPEGSQPAGRADDISNICRGDEIWALKDDYYCTGSSAVAEKSEQEWKIEDCAERKRCRTYMCDQISGEKTIFEDYSCSFGVCIVQSDDFFDEDKDWVDDRCDDCLDADKDGVCEDEDNCPGVWNSLQKDDDNDGIGDLCDDDKDGDGYTLGEDCDDNDPDVYPGALEILNNGKDDDCDAGTQDWLEHLPRQMVHVNVNLLSWDSILPGEYLEIKVDVSNIGSQDIENVKVRAYIVGEYEYARNTIGDLDPDDTESAILILPVSGDIEAGFSHIRITVSNDDFKRVIYREILVG